MSNWPLPFKLRLAGAAGVLTVVVVVLLVAGGGGNSKQALVPVTAEQWQAGQEAGGWVPVEVPAEAAVLAVPPSELAEGRIAAFDLPAGAVVTAEMLREPGARLVDDTATTVWVAADTGRWHGGPIAGEKAVFASKAAGCAALELEVVDFETGQVAVMAGPDLFAALVDGEPWTVWASPVAGWGARCPADATAGEDASGGSAAEGDSGGDNDSSDSGSAG
ncbi:MAG: hypothetical protein F4Y28_02130 [Acidimicrobiia bacterium]|nr:hypothetical protein [Acidimicrobiia bacterium]